MQKEEVVVRAADLKKKIIGYYLIGNIILVHEKMRKDLSENNGPSIVYRIRFNIKKLT